jgi:hypothetical protein
MTDLQVWLASIEADIACIYPFRDWLEEQGKPHENVSKFVETLKTATKIWHGFGKWLGCMNKTTISYLCLEDVESYLFDGYSRERLKRDGEKNIDKMGKAFKLPILK